MSLYVGSYEWRGVWWEFCQEFLQYFPSLTYDIKQRCWWYACMHGIIHIYIKYLKNTQYLYVFKSGVHSHWKDLCTHCTSETILKHMIHIKILSSHNFCGVYHAMMFGGEWIHGNCWENNFVMFWPWWRIGADPNCVCNKISENFSALRLGIEIIKFHV